MAALKWWSFSWKRFGLLLLIVFGGSWVLNPIVMSEIAWYFGRQTVRQNPEVSEMPKPLADTRQMDLTHGMTISHGGYSFRVPWAKEASRNDMKDAVSVHFDDGSGLLMFDPAGAADAIAIWRNQEGNGMPAMRKVMGDQALRSNYDLMVAEMQASPADLSPFNSRLKNTRASLLLINKSLNMSGARQIFSIGANGWRGYQVGDPAAIPVRVRLLLFDAQDHKLELLLSGPKSGGVGVWNQEAINALVASIRPPN